MQTFYEPEILANGGLLNEEESRHCIKVLRHKKGDIVYIIDGKGTRARCQIADASPHSCRVQIINMEKEDDSIRKCHVAIAPTKSIDRFEWFLEKSTELGIDKISPLICSQSERKNIKLSRLERVITAATKQSLRLWQPVIMDLINIQDFLNAEHSEQQKYIAHCDETDRKDLVTELQKHKGNESVLVLIGPEGDFSEEEINMAIANGFIPVSLGKNRLRTETAGIAACMSVYMTGRTYK
jgi:16S rRNA (uracil1498-N3)-methyltransferase